MLIETGLGICDISAEIKKLTDKPVTAVATHIHWDHIGGHKYYPSTDPQAYLNSLEKIAILPVKRVFPAHHTLNVQPEILIRMRDAFRKLDEEGKLHHGSGTFDYGDWAVWL